MRVSSVRALLDGQKTSVRAPKVSRVRADAADTGDL
jgi:hypothetical protein